VSRSGDTPTGQATRPRWQRKQRSELSRRSLRPFRSLHIVLAGRLGESRGRLRQGYQRSTAK
jgi:hypothetical protein